MSTDIVKKGFAAAEQEQQEQEQEISKIKKIVQSYLEKIQEKSERKDELDQEVRLLKKDLDDLKAGRLDRIKERSEKDPKAKEVTLIIIREVQKEYIPMRPWLSPWYVEMKPFVPQYATGYTITTAGSNNILSGTVSGTNTINLCTAGTSFANFTGGSYTVGNSIVNL
jgi:uncharacterized protein (DUF305 family)